MLSLAIGDNDAKDINAKDFFAVSNALLLPIMGRPPTAAMSKVLAELVLNARRPPVSVCGVRPPSAGEVTW